MAGDFDFLHIKGRTVGSSNELSFDVLDAAREELNGKRQRGMRAPSTPGASRGSYHGVAGTSTLSAVPEVERRKRVRRAHTARLWVVGVLVAALVVGAGTYFGYRFYQQRIDFSGHLNTLVDRIIEVDRSLVEIDALMADPFDEDHITDRASARETIPDLKRELRSVKAEAEESAAGNASDREATALGEVVAAAESRMDLLQVAQEAFELSDTVNERATKASIAWSLVLSSDRDMREATTQANRATTEEATVAARDKMQTSLDQMREALDVLAALEKDDRRIDFTAAKPYIQVRIRGLEAAVATSDALLAGDREAAQLASDSFNAAEREAANLAGDLSDSIGNDVKNLYADDMQAALSAYAAARAQVTEADSHLRLSLGS